MSADEQEHIAITLSPDEAIVLHAMLSRWIGDVDDPTPPPACFVGSAECAALHDLLVLLETRLDAPFAGDYAEKLAKACGALAPRWNGADLRD